MVLVSPERVIKRYENASLEEICEEKERLMKFIREYESGAFDGEDVWFPGYGNKYNNIKKIVAGLNQLIEAKKQEQTTKGTETTLIKDLEKIIKFYKEGLLTDDEFAAMKKKLIGD